ncbi:MAG: GNAT family N-acetyltransferase [Actinomycetota bacterium]
MPATYSISTDRLLLRPWKDEDRDPYVALATEEEFSWYPMRRALSRDEAAERFTVIRQSWITRGIDVFAAELKQSGELIGYIGLSSASWLPVVMPATEVGWRLGKKFWGQGYATEGAKACLKLGFEEMLLDRMLCIYEPENVRSSAVAARLGLREYMRTKHPKIPDIEIAVAELSSVRYYATA